MKYIPVTLDLRSAWSEKATPQPLLICTHLDHDLVLTQLRRVSVEVNNIHIYNFIINGVNVPHHLFDELSKLCEFLESLVSYCRADETQTYCPLRMAELLAYHRMIEQDACALLHGLNVNQIIEHSFNLTNNPDQLQDNLKYTSINSLSGDFAVAFKVI